MTAKKSNTKKAAKDKAVAVEELKALAHHIVEALRIMRESEFIPAGIYNDFADAWNELTSLTYNDVWESEEFAGLILSRLAEKEGAK